MRSTSKRMIWFTEAVLVLFQQTVYSLFEKQFGSDVVDGVRERERASYQCYMNGLTALSADVCACAIV